MGKWNQRWLPQRKYRQESSDNSYSHLYSDPLSPDDWKSNVPSWEKQFCLTIGSVPWKKVLVAKKFMHCHDSVVRWNDSANEDAFRKAKNRFLADMDGVPCDIPPPDPNIYIDQIDWDPDIDPQLAADLDKEYFNPDEGQNLKMVEKPLVEHKLSSSYNPWEGSYYKKSSWKDVAQGWNICIREDNNSNNHNNKKTNINNNNIEWRNKSTENPWEQSNILVKGGAVNDTTTTTKTTWLSSGDSCWGWKQKGPLDEERTLLSNNFNSQCGWPTVGSAKDQGWHGSRINNFKGRSQIKNDDMDQGRKRQQHDHLKFDRHNFDSSRGGGVSGFGEWKKREGCHQYSTTRKSPRFHGDDSPGNQQWK